MAHLAAELPDEVPVLPHVPLQRVLVREALLADLAAVRPLAVVHRGDVGAQRLPVKRVERTVRAHEVLGLLDPLLGDSAGLGTPQAGLGSILWKKDEHVS